MLRLSNLADYAVLACTELARTEGRMSAHELSDMTGVPGPTMAKLTGTLTRAGLLSSARGSAGGVMLAREAEAISLANVIEAVDGPIGLVACTHEDGDPCQLSDNCRVRQHWPVVNDRVREALNRTTLAELAREPKRETA